MASRQTSDFVQVHLCPGCRLAFVVLLLFLMILPPLTRFGGLIFTLTLLPLGAAAAAPTPAPAGTLRAAYEGRFLIGAAVNDRQVSGQAEADAALVRQHFNSITPENVLKWQLVHPEPGRYDFEASDRFVAFGEKHGMFMVGHTLIWHNQTPAWVFQDEHGQPLTRDALLKRMRDHIHTVVGRYKGRLHGWDVVNEALDEDGSLRQSPFLQIIGEDYLAHAFRFAHEADPDAELYYNDYNIENEPKWRGAVAMLKRLQEQGVPLTGVGIQNHVNLNWPSDEQLSASIRAFAGLGLKVMITELEVDPLPSAFQYSSAEITRRADLRAELNPYVDGLPPEKQAALAERYGQLFRVYLKHSDVISRVTLWGVHDGASWLNNWPVRGRTSHPLLFDRQLKPKPAFEAVLQAARE
jgi:endo-1,4-beta-xylanase